MNAASLPPAKLRIAMVAACPFPWPRGTPVRARRLAESLHNLGHEVHVITYHLGDHSVALPFHVHRIPKVFTYRKVSPGPTLQKLVVVDFLLWRALRRFLDRVPIDLIHAHHYEGLLTASAANRSHNLPVIYDAHTLLSSELPFYGPGVPSWLKRLVGGHLDHKVPRLAQHVIAVTEQIQQQLCDHGNFHSRDVSVIPNGVEVDFFQQRTDACESPRGHDRVIVYAGTLAAYQGIELLLQAFARLRQTEKGCRLRFVTNSTFARFDPLARELCIRDDIEIVEAAFSELPRELHRADVLVNPRVACDGLPQKLLNYMAAGKPIVSFAGSAKTLKHEKNGLVVEDYDLDAFAAAIARFLKDPVLSQAVAAKALSDARARSWAVVGHQVETVYGAVLRGEPDR